MSAASSTSSPAVPRSKSSPSGPTTACSKIRSTITKGRKQYEAHWTSKPPSPISPQSSPQLPAAGVADRAQHSLQTAFSEIERLSHSVKSAGNPISLDLKTRYIVKGPKKEQTTLSVVNIYTNSAGKIEKVEDKWDGNLPDSSITNVVHYAEAWVF